MNPVVAPGHHLSRLQGQPSKLLSSPAAENLRFEDFSRAFASCTNSDPGPDPTYDPDPIPPEDIDTSIT